MAYSHHPHDIRSVGLQVKTLHTVDGSTSNLDHATTNHKICAMAHYSDEVDQQLFSFVDIAVEKRRGHGISSSIDTLGSWITEGETTGISLCDLDNGGEVLIGIASDSGSLSLLRLLVPRVPGVKAADIQILDLPSIDQKLLPWAMPHSSASSIDFQKSSGGGSAIILSSGLDGSLAVIDTQSIPTSVPLFKPPGLMSYSSIISAKWAGVHSIISLSSCGQIDLYDIRAGGAKPATHAPSHWGAVGPAGGETHLPHAVRRSLPRCMTVHPSRPDLAAVGCSSGIVALWDLRMHAEPLAASLPIGAEGVRGGVTEVLFDPMAPSSTPSFVFSTQDGILAQATSSGNDLAVAVIHDARSSINSFDLSGSDAVFVSDNQELVYINKRQ